MWILPSVTLHRLEETPLSSRVYLQTSSTVYHFSIFSLFTESHIIQFCDDSSRNFWWLNSSLELYDLTWLEFCLKGSIWHDSFPLRDSILKNCRKMFSLDAKQMKCFAAVSNVERNIVCVLRISIRGRLTRSSDWGTSELANNVIVIARLGEGVHESRTACFPCRIRMQLINRTLRCSRLLTNMTSV